MSEQQTDQTAFYALGIAVILGALLLSAAVYFSVDGIAKAISAKNFSVNLQGTPTGGTPSGTGTGGTQTAPQPQQPAAPSEPGRVAIDTTGVQFKGPENARITIIEFSDFECPFCGRAQPTLKQIEATYGDDVRFGFMHFPLSFHPNAQKAGEAFECAANQGMAWGMYTVLFDNAQSLGVSSLKRYAADLGLDVAAFNACLDSGEKADAVVASMGKGLAAGVSGTPTFFINGKPLVGAVPFADFQSIIEAELAS